MEQLLTRDQFREGVFNRDGHKCVMCPKPGVDAHHIIERRLFSDGGYYLSNGASLCQEHHLEAEMTTLTCDMIRVAAGIDRVIIPEHLYDDYEYDKWSNILLPNGTRLKGELFNDESVQKILKQGNVLGDFSKYVKHPKTYHIRRSTLGKDDKMHPVDPFPDEDVVASLKMDGEQTSLYNDHIHARSLDSGSHESRDWVKGLWSRMSYLLDNDMRICGENVFAKHVIAYDDLKSFFYMFSMWSDMTCLSWDETNEYAQILGLETVPEFYRGPYNGEAIHDIFMSTYSKKHEGYVIRKTRSFTYGEFRTCVGKFVMPQFRQALNQSHGHWISQKIIPNKLISK